MDSPDRPDRPEDEVVPDPHRGEALPETQEGTRPGTDASVVRPEQDEPGGPLAGLVGAASAQVAEEATPGGDARVEASLEDMGVEPEGIESGQLLGFVVATLAAVAVLSAVIIYLIYTPFRNTTAATASDVEQYPELHQSRVDAEAKLNQPTRTGDVLTIPIGQAMQRVVAEYGNPSAAGQPTTRQAFNTLLVNRTAGRAVQALTAAPADTSVTRSAVVEEAPPTAPDTSEPTPVTE